MTPSPFKILWVDDEVDLLKPHVMFLRSKGYDVTMASSGIDALRAGSELNYDLMILDEHMPGISGLETLSRFKQEHPYTPVIMITKSEEETIMDKAIGQKIADFLIKPVNPNQILLSLKRLLHSPRLVNETTIADYRDDFNIISNQISSANTLTEWMELYKRLTKWQLLLESPESHSGLDSIFDSQLKDANIAFGKSVCRNFTSWLADDSVSAPVMSHSLMKRVIVPRLESGEKVWLLVVDNFRYDQWITVSEFLGDKFNIDTSMACAILPTATQFCRNSIFSGLLPAKIAKLYPHLWVDDTSEEGKNQNEQEFIKLFFSRYRLCHTFSYSKINDSQSCSILIERLPKLQTNDLNVVVVNFIDMLSHARTDNRAVRELAGTLAAYRSVTASWFRHSPLAYLLAAIADSGATVVLTTDHGATMVNNPVKIYVDADVNDNLRYKTGKELRVDNTSKILEIKSPIDFGLPSRGISSSYMICLRNDFFVYPNNFRQFADKFCNTLQHGGISLQEMLLPLIVMTPKYKI